jgi:hypothetical protein
MKPHKIRFNLGRGVNYMKWKVEYPDKRVEYLDPEKVQLIMYDCTLKNNRKVAQRILDGEITKMVCAYILCERIEILAENFLGESNINVRYNPKVFPYWTVLGTNTDNMKYDKIFSVGNKLFLPPTIVPIWVEDPNE